MNDSFKLSPSGAVMIQHYEGCHKSVGNRKYAAYLDPVQVPTIGWGHTNHHGRKFKMGDVWTADECHAEFLSDMAIFEKDVKRLVTVRLDQEQFDALVSFTYNLGAGNLGKSTLLKKLNHKDYEGAAAEFPKWNKAGGKELPGLTRRRKS